jgi:hypothetical protein
MKITPLEQIFLCGRTRLVKVTTDSGLIGWGETTLESKPRSVAAAVDALADYLIGSGHVSTLLVIGRWTARGVNHGERFDSQVRFLSVYAWRDGIWQMVAEQSTEISGTPS